MSKSIRRKDVNWSKANCKGIDTDLFYTPLQELLEKGMSYRTLRRICFSCPIWKECLQVAMQEEPYGFWGGMSEEERKHLYNKTKPRSMKQLQMDLKVCNVRYKTIEETVEGIERQFMYAPKWR